MGTPSHIRKLNEDTDKLIEQQQKAELIPSEGDALAADDNGNHDPGVKTGHDDKFSTKGLTEDNPEYWKRRFLGLTATRDEKSIKLQTDLDQIRSQFNQVNGQLTQSQNTITELQSRIDIAPAKPAEPVASKVVTMEELMGALGDDAANEYDPQFFKTMAKIVNYVNSANGQTTATSDNERMDKLERRVESAEEKSERIASTDFFSGLRSSVPNWKELQATPEMQKWLLTEDTLLGTTPDKVLQQAAQDKNVTRAIAIFESYKKTLKQTTDNQIIDPLAHKVVPDDAGAGSGEDVGSGTIYKQSEVKEFYDDWAMGKYKKNPEEAERLDKLYEEAHKEGRIGIG